MQELTTKEWNELLDQYLITGIINTERFEDLNEAQRWMINEIKKSTNRIKNK